MPISIRCENPECQKPLRVKDEFAGKRIKCPVCGHVIAVPEAGTIVESAIAAATRRSPPAKERAPKTPAKRSGESIRADAGNKKILMIGAAAVGALLVVVVAITLAFVFGAFGAGAQETAIASIDPEKEATEREAEQEKQRKATAERLRIEEEKNAAEKLKIEALKAEGARLQAEKAKAAEAELLRIEKEKVEAARLQAERAKEEEARLQAERVSAEIAKRLGEQEKESVRMSEAVRVSAEGTKIDPAILDDLMPAANDKPGMKRGTYARDVSRQKLFERVWFPDAERPELHLQLAQFDMTELTKQGDKADAMLSEYIWQELEWLRLKGGAGKFTNEADAIRKEAPPRAADGTTGVTPAVLAAARATFQKGLAFHIDYPANQTLEFDPADELNLAHFPIRYVRAPGYPPDGCRVVCSMVLSENGEVKPVGYHAGYQPSAYAHGMLEAHYVALGRMKLKPKAVLLVHLESPWDSAEKSPVPISNTLAIPLRNKPGPERPEPSLAIQGGVVLTPTLDGRTLSTAALGNVAAFALKADGWGRTNLVHMIGFHTALFPLNDEQWKREISDSLIAQHLSQSIPPLAKSLSVAAQVTGRSSALGRDIAFVARYDLGKFGKFVEVGENLSGVITLTKARIVGGGDLKLDTIKSVGALKERVGPYAEGTTIQGDFGYLGKMGIGNLTGKQVCQQYGYGASAVLTVQTSADGRLESVGFSVNGRHYLLTRTRTKG